MEGEGKEEEYEEEKSPEWRRSIVLFTRRGGPAGEPVLSSSLRAGEGGGTADNVELALFPSTPQESMGERTFFLTIVRRIIVFFPAVCKGDENGVLHKTPDLATPESPREDESLMKEEAAFFSLSSGFITTIPGTLFSFCCESAKAADTPLPLCCGMPVEVVAAPILLPLLLDMVEEKEGFPTAGDLNFSIFESRLKELSVRRDIKEALQSESVSKKEAPKK